MLLINTYVQRSPIQGLGCFTSDSIKKGQLVWTYDKDSDISVLVEKLPDLPPRIRLMLQWYGYGEVIDNVRVITLCCDNARFMNHSLSSNIAEHAGDNYASRDIAAGEELLCNYFDYDLDATEKLFQLSVMEEECVEMASNQSFSAAINFIRSHSLNLLHIIK